MHRMRKYFSTYFTYLEKQDKKTRVLLLIAAFGLLLSLSIAITIPFRDSLFKSFFPKPPARAQEETEPPADMMPPCPNGAEICTQRASDEYWVPITVHKDNGTFGSNPCDVWKEHVFLNTTLLKIKANPEIRCNGSQSNQNVFQLRLKRRIAFFPDQTISRVDWAAPGGIFLHTFHLEAYYCIAPDYSKYKFNEFYWDVSSYRSGSLVPIKHYNGPVSPAWGVIEWNAVDPITGSKICR